MRDGKHDCIVNMGAYNVQQFGEERGAATLRSGYGVSLLSGDIII